MKRARRTIDLRITAELLQALLRLPESTRIIGARVHDGIVTLAIDAPDAPSGTVEMSPTYQRDNHPDPVHLVAIHWRHRDGSETVVEAPRRDAQGA